MLVRNYNFRNPILENLYRCLVGLRKRKRLWRLEIGGLRLREIYLLHWDPEKFSEAA